MKNTSNKRRVVIVMLVLMLAMTSIFGLISCTSVDPVPPVIEVKPPIDEEDNTDKVYSLADINFKDTSPTALNAVTVNAKVYPFNATDTRLEWSVSWKNASSAWATGKSVTNYVTAVAIENTTNATITELEAFGETIILTATSVQNPTVKASVEVNHIASVVGYVLGFSYNNVNYIVKASSTTPPPGINVPLVRGQLVEDIHTSLEYSSVHSVSSDKIVGDVVDVSASTNSVYKTTANITTSELSSHLKPGLFFSNEMNTIGNDIVLDDFPDAKSYEDLFWKLFGVYRSPDGGMFNCSGLELLLFNKGVIEIDINFISNINADNGDNLFFPMINFLFVA